MTKFPMPRTALWRMITCDQKACYKSAYEETPCDTRYGVRRSVGLGINLGNLGMFNVRLNLDTRAFSCFLPRPSEKMAPRPAIEPATSSCATPITAASKRTKLKFMKRGKAASLPIRQPRSFRRKQPPISSHHQSW